VWVGVERKRGGKTEPIDTKWKDTQIHNNKEQHEQQRTTKNNTTNNKEQFDIASPLPTL
jgi:hypothetical protein